MRSNGFRLREVIEEFRNVSNVPKVKLACGHIKTDPMFYYGNETRNKIKMLYHTVSGERRKVRCYECMSESTKQ